jgi:hypothetical protein
MPTQPESYHGFIHAGAGTALFMVQLSAIIPGLLPMAALTALVAAVLVVPLLLLVIALAVLVAPPAGVWLVLRRLRGA